MVENVIDTSVLGRKEAGIRENYGMVKHVKEGNVVSMDDYLVI